MTSLDLTFALVDQLIFERDVAHFKKLGMSSENARDRASLAAQAAQEDVDEKRSLIWSKINEIDQKSGIFG